MELWPSRSKARISSSWPFTKITIIVLTSVRPGWLGAGLELFAIDFPSLSSRSLTTDLQPAYRMQYIDD